MCMRKLQDDRIGGVRRGDVAQPQDLVAEFLEQIGQIVGYVVRAGTSLLIVRNQETAGRLSGLPDHLVILAGQTFVEDRVGVLA